MRAFLVIVILVITAFFLLSFAFEDNALAPAAAYGNGGVAQVQPTMWAPVATPIVSTVVRVDEPAIPVTGSGANVQSGAQIVYVPAPQSVGGIPVTGSAACPNPYIVQFDDSVSKIAQACNTNVQTLLAINPAIYNPNLVFPGQILWTSPTVINGTVGIPVTGGGIYVPTPLPSDVNPVYVYPNGVITPGTTVNVTVHNFPANVPVAVGVGRPGMGYQIVNQSITDQYGDLYTEVVVPADADPNVQWSVVVVTTSGELKQIASQPFQIMER